MNERIIINCINVPKYTVSQENGLGNGKACINCPILKTHHAGGAIIDVSVKNRPLCLDTKLCQKCRELPAQ